MSKGAVADVGENYVGATRADYDRYCALAV
jgi:hypothetical protein